MTDKTHQTPETCPRPQELFEQLRLQSENLSDTNDSHVIYYYSEKITDTANQLDEFLDKGLSKMADAKAFMSATQAKLSSDSARASSVSKYTKLIKAESQLLSSQIAVQKLAAMALTRRTAVGLPPVKGPKENSAKVASRKNGRPQQPRALSSEDLLELPIDSVRLCVEVDGRDLIIGIPAYNILNIMTYTSSAKHNELLRSVLRLGPNENIDLRHERQFRTAVEQVKQILKPGKKRIFSETGTVNSRRLERHVLYKLGNIFVHTPPTDKN